jgi:uncharacterized OB-fold protein
MTAAKPSPLIDVWNKPFWDACAERRIVLQRCDETGKCWYPPSPRSPYAPRSTWKWVSCSGQAKLLSWVVFHQKYFEGFADEIPYVVAMVELDEGARMLTNLKGSRDGLAVGARVTVNFEDRGERRIPVFALAAA